MTFLETLNQYSGLIALGGPIVAACAAFFFKAMIADAVRGFVTRGELDAVAEEVESLGDRLVDVEATLKHLPNANALQGLAISVTELRGDLKTASAELRGVKELQETLSHQVQVMDGFLRQMKQ